AGPRLSRPRAGERPRVLGQRELGHESLVPALAREPRALVRDRAAVLLERVARHAQRADADEPSQDLLEGAAVERAARALRVEPARRLAVARAERREEPGRGLLLAGPGRARRADEAAVGIAHVAAAARLAPVLEVAEVAHERRHPAGVA